MTFYLHSSLQVRQLRALRRHMHVFIVHSHDLFVIDVLYRLKQIVPNRFSVFGPKECKGGDYECHHHGLCYVFGLAVVIFVAAFA